MDHHHHHHNVQSLRNIFPRDGAHRDDDDAFFRSLPPGFRFNPTDEELIVHYLTRKVHNQTLPRNRITPLNLYDYNPQMLPNIIIGGEGGENNGCGGRDSYYFTPRHRKYLNGQRPNRAAGDGYWKATGADKKVENSRGEEIGFKKTLVFYHGKPPAGEKTSWIMHEYRINASHDNCDRTLNKMMLDNWVLCKVYEKLDTKNGKKKKDNENTDDGSENEDEEEDDGGGGNDDHNDKKPVVGDRSNSPVLASAPAPVPVDPIKIVPNQNKNQNQNLLPVYDFMNHEAMPFQQHHQKPVVMGDRSNSSVFAPASVHVPVDAIRIVPNQIQNQNQNQPPMYGFMNQATTPFEPALWAGAGEALWELAYPLYMNQETTYVYDSGVNINYPNNPTMEQIAQQIVTCRRGFIIDNNDNNSSFSSNGYNYLENEDLHQGVYIQQHTTEDTIGTYENDEKPQDNETPHDVYKDIH